MRIIHIVRAKNWGGGERYALDLVNRSVENGDDVTVVSRGLPAIDERFRNVGAEMCKMPLGGVADFMSPWKLARLAESFPDEKIIIHVHNFKDAEIAARAKRLISNKKRVNLVCTRHLVKSGKTGLRWRNIYSGIDNLIFVSELAKREFLKTSPEIDKSKVSVVANSIVLPDEYSEAKARDVDRAEKICLFVGRLDPEKGLDVLIKAMAKLSRGRYRLRIVGTGKDDYLKELQRSVAEEGIEDIVEWEGFRDDVFKEIGEADICVAPSVGRESFGLTILEYMSQCRPVVTTSNGAQREILTDGCDGMLVEPGSVDALAHAIQTLADDARLRNRMAQAAYDKFRLRFSYDVFFKKIYAIYNS
ncbi:MAG: glycosyltransferase family 4 protein [Muribaculaceae bacterium]|nr:glycosyltransferase family 4 protein [Muribaculaceae bacterium]